MAKELSKVGIITGNDIEAHHVTQSVDAFTGLDAYDVTLSGSLEVTGSTKIKGDVETTNGSIVATNGNIISSVGNVVATAGKVIATSITSSGGILGVTISASADLYVEDDLTVGDSLEVRSNITASNNISASGDIYGTNFIASSNITSSANISASGDIYGTNFIASSDITSSNNISASGFVIGDIIYPYSKIEFSDPNSQLNLGTGGDIRMGNSGEYFLKTETYLQQVNLNKNSSLSSQVVLFAGDNSGLNLRNKGQGVNNNNTLTSSLDLVNFSGKGELKHNWGSTYINNSTGPGSFSPLDIVNNIPATNPSSGVALGGRIRIGTSTNYSNNIDIYTTGSTAVNSLYHGLQINGLHSALELKNDNAFKLTNANWVATSDSRLKENIITASIDVCYDGVKNLPLKYYKWKEEISVGPVDDEHMLGWIAQDVEAIFPKAIKKSNFTTWSTYTGSEAITGSDNLTILEPGERYQDVLAGSEIIEDRHALQSDQIIKMMYGAIQKLQEKVEALESQISGSNS